MADSKVALQALSQALKLEREGLAFYERAAQEVLDEKCKATFSSLADDERQHAEIVQRQLHSIEGNGQYVLLPDIEVTPVDLRAPMFAPDLETMQKQLGTEPTEVQALHIALEIEIKSYDLYRTAAQETTDEDGSQMYRWLASAEMTHFNLLMSNYEALVSTAGWE